MAVAIKIATSMRRVLSTSMSPQREPTSAPSDARAQRRWLIGLAITVLFGIFGAVMAVLAYRDSTSSPGARAPAGTTAPAPTGAAPSAPDSPGEGKSHGRK
jgi:hypothetical protein